MNYLFSAIGRKQLMAVTGIAWSLFVLSHMAANLLILFDAEAYNKYSHALISNPAIYIAEAGLVLMILVHIVNGIKLTIENKAARPQKYAMVPSGEKAPRFQSKWMVYHGTLLAIFLVWHLVTFKFGTYYAVTYDGVEMRDLHRLVLEVFQEPFYVVFYLLCMVAVGFHLSHGFYSSFASLGLYHPRFSPMLSKFGVLYAVIVAAGFMSQPIYVFFLAGK
ncbi:MAG: succinate dehydrogenase cytochrome b subunit [Bdellovibrionales bacterium]|nr:succinate dehydrogenase cytochrome b subunit [Bdellovibrionales bacterium]